MGAKLKHEVKFPSKEDMERRMADCPEDFLPATREQMADIGLEQLCYIIDGTEVRVTKASTFEKQRATYSGNVLHDYFCSESLTRVYPKGKKHQNSNNILVISDFLLLRHE